MTYSMPAYLCSFRLSRERFSLLFRLMTMGILMLLGTLLLPSRETPVPARLWQPATITATYQFDLNSTPANTAVSPRFFGTNFSWPFVPFDAATGQIADTEIQSALSELGASNFYRFPGGHWSEWYQWYWGIGPQAERPWVALPPARQPLPNAFGTIEFLETIRAYGSNEATFTINYLTGSYTTTQKWIEFVNGEFPSEAETVLWTDDCWGDGGPSECWRSKRWLTVTQAITAGATTLEIAPESMPQLGFYLDPEVFDPVAANCDTDSRDGYGQDGCADQNRYEYKKISINVGGEWMIVDQVDGSILTVRRADEARSDHSAGVMAYFWDYSNLGGAPQGYFAWLRAQLAYGGTETPYDIHYWEVGNEPFWAIVDGNHDGIPECNFWYPCVEEKANPSESVRIATYIAFYNQVASLNDGSLKFGLDLRAYIDYSNLAGDFENVGCNDILQGWNAAFLEMIPRENLDFVAPHFYVWGNDVDNFALVTHPDRISKTFVRLQACLEESYATPPEILPNEFVLLYNGNDHAYGWWTELDSNAGRWRDGLFMASLLTHFMEMENVSGANYWHLMWSGFLGRVDAAYPYAGQFSQTDFSQPGPLFETYKYLSRYTYGHYFTPTLESPITETLLITTTGGAPHTLTVDPLLVYATAGPQHSAYSFVIINRAPYSIPVSLTLACNDCALDPHGQLRIDMRGESYTDIAPDIEVHALGSTHTMVVPTEEIVFQDTIAPHSVTIVARPYTLAWSHEVYLPLMLRGETALATEGGAPGAFFRAGWLQYFRFLARDLARDLA